MKLFKKTLLLTIALFLSVTQPAFAATTLYPDLKTIAPNDIQYDTEEIDGNEHVLLRFSNTVWNAGQGPLEIYGTQASEDRTRVTQRLYDDEGNSKDEEVGYVVFHDAHNHWHFENFAEYQLWTKEDYDEWIAEGRQEENARFNGYKTTFCIRETVLIERLPGTPEHQRHIECGQEKQAISVGWGDTYRYDLPEQWIDLGDDYLPDGNYVLRSIADPMNLLKESADNTPDRESDEANEAVTYFSVHEGEILEVDRGDSIVPGPENIPPLDTPTPTPGLNSRSNTDYESQLVELRTRLDELLRNLTNNA